MGFAQHCVLSISVGPPASLGCVDLCSALIKLRADWAEGEVERTFQSVEEGTSNKTRSTVLKVVMTGSAEDGPEWQKHIGSKEARRKLASC